MPNSLASMQLFLILPVRNFQNAIPFLCTYKHVHTYIHVHTKLLQRDLNCEYMTVFSWMMQEGKSGGRKTYPQWRGTRLGST